MPPRPTHRELRASDSDRDRVVALLSEAVTDGRLSHDEYSERVSAALSARTLGELAGLTVDLAPPGAQPVQVDSEQPMLAVFSTASRSGGWVVPGVLPCLALFGEAVLDLSEARLTERHVVVNVYALFGRVRLIVPAGVEVVLHCTPFFGSQRGATARRVPTAADAPVIEVRGYLVVSEILARTPSRPPWWKRIARA